MTKILRVGSAKPRACVATIGNFDGFHVGHQEILKSVQLRADALGVPGVVILFEPSPLEFFKGEEAPTRVMSLSAKVEFLTGFGMGYVMICKFDGVFANTSAEDFIANFIVGDLNVQHLVVGNDFKFGKGSSGNYALLQQKSEQYGFGLERKKPVTVDGIRVSSTLLRQELLSRNLEKCKTYLQRDFSFFGRVCGGQKLGRTLGFPTLNLSITQPSLPLSGVFAVEVVLDNDVSIQGACNIGYKPTVKGIKPSIEVHCLDWSFDWWQPKHMKVMLKKMLREEKKFTSLDALTTQITLDVEQCRQYFSAS